MPYKPRSGGGCGGDIAQAGGFSTGMRRYGRDSESSGNHGDEWDARNGADHPGWWRIGSDAGRWFTSISEPLF